MPKILLIIPAYNEEESIKNVYKKIQDYNQKNELTVDAIVINDCSKDNTKGVCELNDIPHINLIHNLGIGGAVQTGYKFAKENGYDIAIQFDGDGQHDVEYVNDLISPIVNGKADFVIGSRFVDHETSEFKSTVARQIGIKVISTFIKLVTRQKVLDTTSGFRAVNKEIISLFAECYPVEYPEPVTTTELLKKKYRLVEVAVKMYERDTGTSSISSWKNIYYMVNVVLSILLVGIRRY